MRSVPCAPDNSTLHTTGDEAVVCWDKGCMKLDMSTTEASWIVKPAAAKTWLNAQAEVKDDQVCLATQCKKFGKKLTAAIADAKKNHDPQSGPLTFQGTTDLKAVVVSGEPWNVAGDSKLRLTTPKAYAKTGEKPSSSNAVVAGNLLVVSWSACAGPCTMYQITDSAGRPKGAEGPGGGEVFQLDAKRFAVVSEYAQISIFELATGKPRGVAKLGAGPEQNWTVRGDDTTMFTMYQKNDGFQVVKINAYDDKGLEPSWDQSMYLPNCSKP